MREHAGSSLVLSLLIVAGFAILLFPDEKGRNALAAKAGPTATQTAARATPATPLPPPPTLPAPATGPSIARSTPTPTEPVATRSILDDAPPRRAVAEAEPIHPRATFTAASRPVPTLINEDDVPRLEPVDLAEMRPELVRRRVSGSWQAGPAARGR